jgi:transposase-like protein
MTEDKRIYRTGQQKVAILKEHLLDKKEVSAVCEAHGVAPGLFYGC